MGLPVQPVRRFFFRTTTSFFSTLSAILLSIYQATLDVRVEGEDHLLLLQARRKNFIVAVWHTFVDAAVFALHHRGLLIYSDHPRTDEYQNSWTHYFREIGIKTLRALGFDVLDASLGKQSQGIVSFIKSIKSGTPALVAPDGPHGPNYEAKPGTVYMASKSDSVVLPIGISCSRQIVGPNWDDFVLPLPFSRVVMTIGEPIVPPTGKLSEEDMNELAAKMEASMDELCFRANEILFGKAPESPGRKNPPRPAATEA